ncbi:hypothetical protein A8A01_01385 [Ewingella americana]|nr:hypothetical protein A8A01_01385 [Ewingella americana]
MYVHSLYDEDYLVFNEDVFAGNDDLYIEISVLELLGYSVSAKNLDFTSDDEEPLKIKYATEKYNFALCLAMRKVVVESDGIPIVSKLKPEYDAMWKANVSESTLCEWFVKPEPYTDKRQRFTLEKRKGMYLFLLLFCKKNKIKNTKGKASAIATELNKMAALEPFCFDVEFTADDVKPWLEEP